MQRLGAYFKVKGMIYINFQNLVIFFSLITINKHHYDVLPYIFESYSLYSIFIGYVIVPYEF